MTLVLFILNLACICSALLLSWIHYKMKKLSYFLSAFLSVIFYQALYLDSNSNTIKLAISMIFIAILLVLIKKFTNKINDEYNKRLLESMEYHFQKYAIKTRKR